MNTLKQAGARYASAMSQLGVVLLAASVIHVMFGAPGVQSDPSTQIEEWRIVATAVMGVVGIVVGAHWGE